MQKATLIYNPLAGPLNLVKLIEKIADVWHIHGWEMTIQTTEYSGHATSLARDAVQAGHEIVLAAGGDGTLGEVASGLIFTNTILVPIPVGTSNSFAKELKIPRLAPLTVQPLLDALLNGCVYQMDMGSRGEQYWLLWSGIGADGHLVHAVEPRPKWSKRLGRFGYMLQGLPNLADLSLMEAMVTIDGRSYHDHFTLILISYCRRYMGGIIRMNPQATLDDGLFEVWLCRGQRQRQAIEQLLTAGIGQHQRRRDMELVNGRHITIHTTEPILCQTDGERAAPTPMEVKLHPRALRILIPNTAPPDLFIQKGTPFTPRS